MGCAYVLNIEEVSSSERIHGFSLHLIMFLLLLLLLLLLLHLLLLLFLLLILLLLLLLFILLLPSCSIWYQGVASSQASHLGLPTCQIINKANIFIYVSFDILGHNIFLGWCRVVLQIIYISLCWQD